MCHRWCCNALDVPSLWLGRRPGWSGRGRPGALVAWAPTVRRAACPLRVRRAKGHGLAVATGREWLAGARPRTLPAAIVPVLAGSAVAAGYGRFSAWRAVLALFVALALQVGVNYANDYSDGVRGTDENRTGPVRLVAGGLAPPRQVLAAAAGCLAAACVAGLVLAAAAGWWLIAPGAAAVAAAWYYTGGRRPYGYHGLGELSVFAF